MIEKISNNKKIAGAYVCVLLASFVFLKIVGAFSREIDTDLQYMSGTRWDLDEDGIETIDGVIDLTIKNTKFNWNMDEGKLCTKWEVGSLDTDEVTSVCYGSVVCCGFMDVVSSSSYWDDPFYLSYGKYRATSNNIVSAKVIYADFSLNFENPYADVIHGNWSSMPARFVNDGFESYDVTVSVPPLFVIEQGMFDMQLVLTNYGNEVLRDMRADILYAPCLDFAFKGKDMPDLGAGKSEILVFPVKAKDNCLSNNYIVARVGGKYIFKTIT